MEKITPCPQPGLSPDLAHGSELCVFLFFVFFWFSRGFGQIAKNHGKTKTNKKNKKFRPMSPARPLPRPCPWVWTFWFFCFFWFSRGFGQIAKNHGKTKKNKKTKKFRPMSPARPLPRPCPWVWTFCFFGFLEVLAKLQKTMEKPKKTKKPKKPKSSDPYPQPGLSPDLAHGSELCVFFLFFLVFSRFWPNCKKPWKNQKKKNKKFRPMSPARPLPRPCPWVWTFCFFCFFWFSRGFGQIAKNHGKTKKPKKTKSSDPCPQPGLSPDLAHGSELCVFFFCFLEVLAKLQKTMEKQKKQKKQKIQTHVLSQASSQTLPMGLNFFFWFSRGFSQTAKNHGKTKKTKSSDLCPQPGLSPDLAHGSELFVFFCFFDFSIVFCMFFMWICFHHSTSQKMRVSTICTPAPPRPNCKKTWKNKLHLMTYIMTNIMILYIYIYHDLFNK